MPRVRKRQPGAAGRRERPRRPARLAARGDYARLLTERPNPRSRDLDVLSTVGIARLMNREDAGAVRAVGREAPAIARAVDLIVAALGARGRLIFVGAGTSGRLGVLEAAECPPTFGTAPGLVQAIMAGGRASVFRSREGAEDDEAAGRSQVRKRVRCGDVVVGISASGVTPFVRAALEEARARGARTVIVRCTPQPRRACRDRGAERSVADVVIAPAPGPEVIAGSTRLKAGTATKLVLNTLTTASMVRLGKVYGNRMVDLQPRSMKLQARALRLVEEIAAVPPVRARRALAEAGGRARLAIVIARTGLSARAARRALGATGGALRPLLDRSPAARARQASERIRWSSRAPGSPGASAHPPGRVRARGVWGASIVPP
ncbi:MAG: N-acetylmuramic acid 6-phosphate etherase [Candidatus Rokubacteria bacterium]|nr:N-acetylmuramic acid 6-phosphate etherase [Candidatus Rokubacteria bacterium]